MPEQISICISNAHPIFCEGIKAVLRTHIKQIDISVCEIYELREYSQNQIFILDITNLDEIDLLACKETLLQKPILFFSSQKPERVNGTCFSNESYFSISSTCSVIHFIQEINKIVKEFRIGIQHEKQISEVILTGRETEIAQLIIKGKTTSEIAETLFLSPHTVHTHRKNIFKKLEVHSPLELSDRLVHYINK